MDDLDLDCLDRTTAYDDDHIGAYIPRQMNNNLTQEEKDEYRETHKLSGWTWRK